MQVWNKALASFLNLFLQSHCPLCQRSAPQELCQNCTQKLQKFRLSTTSSLRQDSVPIFVWGAYGGMLKRAIAIMKYENQPQIARPLGKWLGEAWLLQHECDRKLKVVPIPLHPQKLQQRGYNQAALIAQSFCEITGLKLKQNGLERVKATDAQFGLSASEREKNLTAAFELGQDFYRRPDAPVLLVDDIYTTGATTRAAVQTLRQNGIAVSGLVAVATTVKDG
ncbi:ComF family protein [Chlorogloeopsis sp. ULAP01]|uniref:ComF family protein n=1 Tax=Chlorogloeopsis sp. ULAP01 TaxID=3056483 RepID=UPI0025AAEE01|nr:ComF family protein [Chlorogloeopsis sp. ULAP01]MDM9381183.1 ComF family protein [Chlorogloeopsis sp. ULAP01]